jgi:hypothetical protein
MLGGTTGVADVIVLLFRQMAFAIAEIAVCLLLLVLASGFVLRTLRQQLRHDEGALLMLHIHDPRAWMRRRGRRAVRRVTVSSARGIRWLDDVVRH